MSKRKSGLNVHGILLLDKRIDVSSNRALQEVRRLFNANKAGHTGSLDPLASGLLPLCFGEATKVSGMMLDDDKRYEVTMTLGVQTDTGDAEGQVIQQLPVPELTEAMILECLQGFVGTIQQVPPMYSALKHQGKKLYELARAGEHIDREARTISIFSLTLLDWTANTITLDVSCSKGTYIRALVEDIGLALHCCATVTMLRRTGAGQFNISQARTFAQLSVLSPAELQACLLPVDQPLSDLPVMQLSEAEAVAVRHGQLLKLSANAEGMVRLYHAQQFLGLGEMQLDGKLAPKKLFNMNS